tara:strand:- start:515 stop:670 length:156 start_codon:yes stop_codon:yes gene_type:complete
LTASKGIRKTNAVTGKQVNTTIANIFASLSAIRAFSQETVVAKEQVFAMAA